MVQTLRRLRSWLRELWAWLGEVKVVSMGILVVSAALLLGLHTFGSAFSILVAGLALQVIGMGFAIHGLVEIRNHFDGQTLRGRLREWLKRFPTWRPSGVCFQAPPLESKVSLHGEASAWAPDNPNSPPEHRIAQVAKNLETVHVKQKQQAEVISSVITNLEALGILTAEQIAELKNEIQSDFEAAHVDGFSQALVGLVFITFGIPLSTLAPELACFLAP